MATESTGELAAPPGAPWGAQTERALHHFAIGTQAMPHGLLQAMVLIKAVAAVVNGRLGRLEPALAQAIAAAADELLHEPDPAAFPLSPWQSGSGTQSHMNVNEVIAKRAAQRLGRAVHPNDDVNRGQSSNDVVPSALHIGALFAWRDRLQPALDTLAAELAGQAALHAALVKLGRTHLQDAVPLTLGQEIGAWRSQLLAARAGIERAAVPLHELALGGTAVGTGLNTHPDFAVAACRELAVRTGVAFAPAADRVAAVAGQEALASFHAALKGLAIVLHKIAGDVRLLASGPRAGLGELVLPANEPGSSIMPGKVNPTQCEALVMVCLQVFANDLAVTLGAAGGQLQLNTCRPLIAVNLFASLGLLADACGSFAAHAVRGLAADPARIGELLGRSLMLVTALVPRLGYDRAARIAQRAHADGTTLREAAIADGVPAVDFDRWADPAAMLGPA